MPSAGNQIVRGKSVITRCSKRVTTCLLQAPADCLPLLRTSKVPGRSVETLFNLYMNNGSVPRRLFLVQAEARDLQSRTGKRLRQLRREYKLSQVYLATTIGTTRNFLSEVEQGRKPISLQHLSDIAQIFELILSELLQGV